MEEIVNQVMRLEGAYRAAQTNGERFQLFTEISRVVSVDLARLAAKDHRTFGELLVEIETEFRRLNLLTHLVSKGLPSGLNMAGINPVTKSRAGRILHVVVRSAYEAQEERSRLAGTAGDNLLLLEVATGLATML